MICHKDFHQQELWKCDQFKFQVGDICLIKIYDLKVGHIINRRIWIGPWKEGTIPLYQTDSKVFDHFMTIEDWRNQKIETICDVD